MLVGTFVHTVDVKGRIFIPARFRLVLGTHFYLCKSFDGCIRAYCEEEWKKLVALISQLSIQGNKFKRLVLGSAVEVDADAQGRILLPEELRTEAMITDRCKIVGMESWAEFWCPERVDEVNDSIDLEEAIAALAEIGFK